MNIDLDVYRAHERDGYITCRAHPEYPLLIWNYTAKAQYENVWDAVTMTARGLITEEDGKVVARPFQKFFNADQLKEPLPLEPFTVTEKMDGSLFILCLWHNQIITATRGSFQSEQALHGRNVLFEKYGDFEVKNGYTYLFEVIFPENRVVVDYGAMDDLVLLALIETESGRELPLSDPLFHFPFPVVKQYDGVEDVAELAKIQEANQEGFVVRFASGLRVKIKMEEYKRLHRLLTQCSARTIWELLKNNQSIDQFLERVPDEFYAWVKKTHKELCDQFEDIQTECRVLHGLVSVLPSRKEQAEVVLQTTYSGIVFTMLDGKPYQEAIWKMLRPKAERPFVTVDEEA